MALPTKAPLDRLDYLIPVPVALQAGETIVSGSVTPMPAGLTVDSVTPSGAALLAWIEGGATQILYALACTAVTSQGRTIPWSSSIYVGTAGLDDPSPIAPLAPLG